MAASFSTLPAPRSIVPAPGHENDQDEDEKDILVPGRVVAPGEWDFPSVCRALDNQLNGDFDRPTQLWRAMVTDATIRGSSQKRCGALVQSPLRFEGKDADTIAWLEAAYPEILPEDEFVQLLSWYHGIGVGLGQLMLTLVDGRYILRLKVLDPYGLRWNYFGFPGWSWQDAERGRVQITPGHNGHVVLSQYNPTQACGHIAGCGKVWQRKADHEASLTDYLDNAGYPITHVGGVPDVNRRLVANELAKARVSKTLVTPEAYKVDVLSSSPDASPDGHLAAIERGDRKIIIEIEGSHLSSEMIAGGSYAASEVHNGVARRTVMMDAARISTQLRRQVFEPNLEINGIASRAPYPKFDVSAPVDVKATIETSQLAFQLLDAAKTSGYEITNFADVLKGAAPEVKRIESNV